MTKDSVQMPLASSTLSQAFRHTPTEIILQIVDAAWDQPDKALLLSLALVASWVRIRVDVLIYRTVVLSSPSRINLFAQTISTRPASFFAKTVRQLWIASTDGDDLWLNPDEARNVSSILAACSGVIDLTLDQSYLVDHPDLPSRTESLTVVSQFIFFLHLTSAPLERVTHLCLINGQFATFPNAAWLPALTHVTMTCCENFGVSHIVKCIAALLESRTLRRLVVAPWQMPGPLSSTYGLSSSFAEELACLGDPRVIAQPKSIDPIEYFDQWKTRL